MCACICSEVFIVTFDRSPDQEFTAPQVTGSYLGVLWRRGQSPLATRARRADVCHLCVFLHWSAALMLGGPSKAFKTKLKGTVSDHLKAAALSDAFKQSCR